MKLETTLPERPGFFHVLPIFDLFALFLVLFLLGPTLVSFSGVEVELPVSRFRLERHEDAAVVTLMSGDPPVIWLERERVDEVDLMARLAARRTASGAVPVVYLRSEGETTVATERRLAEMILEQGSRVFLLGRAEDGVE